MKDTILPQLQTIETDLASQEAGLIAQLNEVKAKLKGVRAVLPMFAEGSTEGSTNGFVSSLDVEDIEIAPIDESPVAEDAEDAEETAEEFSEPAADEPTAAVPVKTERKTRKTKTTTAKKKKDGRLASWQKYVRSGVEEQPMPEAVTLILQTQPGKSFKIAEVMEALFEEGIPKSQYLKARNRISNILSAGARNGEWNRGKGSTYSISGAK